MATLINVCRRAFGIAVVCVGAMAGAGKAACPSPPPGFSGSAATPCMARVSWSAAVGASGYRLWRSPVNDLATAAVYPDLPPSLLTIGDTVVVPNQTYYYWIATLTTDTASCPSGVGPIGSPVAVGVVGSSPGVPFNVTATGGCNAVTVRWNTAAGVASYQVLRSPFADLSGAQIAAEVNPMPLQTSVSIMAPAGPTFNYWVRAINSCGTSQGSAAVQALAVSLPPAAIQNFQVSDGTRCDGILVTWDMPVPAPASYTMTRTSSGGEVITNTFPGTTPGAVLILSATAGVPYTIALTPSNGCGAGPTASRPGAISFSDLNYSLQPVSRMSLPHGTVSFSVSLGGPGSPAATVVWRKNGVPVTLGAGGGKYTQQQWTLTVHDIVPEDAAMYDCVAGANLGAECSIVSNGAVLGVRVDCRADYNLSGMLSVQDLFDYLAGYFGGCP